MLVNLHNFNKDTSNFLMDTEAFRALQNCWQHFRQKGMKDKEKEKKGVRRHGEEEEEVRIRDRSVQGLVPGLLCFPLLSSHQDTWDDPGKRLHRDKGKHLSR